MNCPFCGREMEPGELRLTGATVHTMAAEDPGAAWLPPPVQNARGRLSRDEARAVPLTLELGKKTLRETLGLAPDVWGDRFYLQNAWHCTACRKAICVLEEPEPEAGPPVQTACPDGAARTADTQAQDRPPRREKRERAPWEYRERPPWEK